MTLPCSRAREGVALETSYANGGMFTPSMPEPWNSPGRLQTSCRVAVQSALVNEAQIARDTLRCSVGGLSF